MSDVEIDAEEVRSRAAALVGLIAVLMFAGSIAFNAMFAHALDGRTDNISKLVETDQHPGVAIGAGLFYGVATILLGLFLTHIALAIRSRRPTLPRLLPLLSFGGPLIVSLAMPVFVIAQLNVANKFADSASKTSAVADKLLDGGGYHAASFALSFGLFATSIAWLMVSAYGMRAGLLAKLVAGVGIAIGVLNLIGATYATPIALATLIEIFWIGSVSIMLYSGPDQKPPAWPSGRNIPWSEVNAAKQKYSAENATDFPKSSVSNGNGDGARAIDAPTDDN